MSDITLKEIQDTLKYLKLQILKKKQKEIDNRLTENT